MLIGTNQQHEVHRRRIFAAAKSRFRLSRREAGQRVKHTQRYRTLVARSLQLQRMQARPSVPSRRTPLSLAPDPPAETANLWRWSRIDGPHPNRTIAEWRPRGSACLRSLDQHHIWQSGARGGEGVLVGCWASRPEPNRGSTHPIAYGKTAHDTGAPSTAKSLQLQTLSRLLTSPNQHVPHRLIEATGTSEGLPGHTNPLILQCYAMR